MARRLASQETPPASETVSLLTGPLDIEGCWWAVVDKGATIRPGNTTEDLSSALLLGTGVEDLFGNAFGPQPRNVLFQYEVQTRPPAVVPPITRTAQIIAE